MHDPEHDQTIPLAVSGEGSLPSAPLVSTVAVGASSACAVHDGDVHCWGANVAGQLGADDPEHTEAGTTEVQPPVRVARVGTGESQLAIDARVDALAVGTGVSGADSWCSLSQRPTALPQVHCWGGDTHGQLGLGATGDRRVPHLLLAHPASGLPSGVEVGGITAGADLTMLWAAP